ncbi:MAG: TIGR00282 family metallophosphoesterase [Ruminiclostridium sp.]|nr:TIGR00282 family metallophosphoesterase [Ruminiclostridium sp.]
MKVFFIGDIFARSGRSVLTDRLKGLKDLYGWDFCIANAENAAGGKGINFNTADEIFNCGVDAITMGNHTWARKEILNFIDSCSKLIRPANYPKGVPGKSRMVIEKNGIRLGLVNLLGRTYMDMPCDCPFQAADRELSVLKQQCQAILIDIHAEATSEKAALAHYVDGRASAVLGTHTHVQTADERILSGGTAFITDVGMTGPMDGIIGVDKAQIIQKFITGLPGHFEPAEGRLMLNAVLITIDDKTGRALEIKRIFEIYR